MKYTIAVLVLIAAFYLGAHSQQKGPTFVTGVTINGKTYYGNIELRGSSTPDGVLSVSPVELSDGKILVQFDYYQYPKQEKK